MSDCEDELTPEERKELRLRGQAKPRARGYYDRQADALVDLQMREAILRWGAAGISEDEIARRLNQPLRTIRRLKRESLEMSKRREVYAKLHPELALPPPPRADANPRAPRWSGRGSGPGPHILNNPNAFKKAYERRAYWPEGDRAPAPRSLPPPTAEDGRGGSAAPGRPSLATNPIFASDTPPPPPPSSVTGEVLDPADVLQLRQDCLKLRKAAIPFSKMAIALGITEQEARRYTAEAINAIQRSEQMNADMERQLMVEQLDQMIAAVHAPATGYMLNDERTGVVFEAIDRMMKLLKQKADLLGLDTAPAIDIRIQIQRLADEGGYDVTDLEDIARDVLQAHRVRLPEFR